MNPCFRIELSHALQNLIEQDMGYDEFKDIFMKILSLHAPLKQKTVRGNNAPFINQTLSHAFMHRSKLKNIFHKNPTDENKEAYRKQ